jgi:hypothetical protein
VSVRSEPSRDCPFPIPLTSGARSFMLDGAANGLVINAIFKYEEILQCKPNGFGNGTDVSPSFRLKVALAFVSHEVLLYVLLGVHEPASQCSSRFTPSPRYLCISSKCGGRGDEQEGCGVLAVGAGGALQYHDFQALPSKKFRIRICVCNCTYSVTLQNCSSVDTL